MELPPIRIPRERLGVLIGENGAMRGEIEARSGVSLRIESETGEVWVDSTKAFDPALALQAAEIVKAIGRGFAPERALRLFQQDAYLEIHDIDELAGKNVHHPERVRARLIGTHGRTRVTVEEMTGAFLSIYGKTVGIIGEPEELELAREAVLMLVRGAPQNAVYKWLTRKRRELRLKELGLA